ncbi:MAG: adenylate/guanylate cyclase domain-containing protein [Solidesulfovibrio sp.]|uniref:CHASE2 domain-containing protein n=1 Tax=Solidesulfovibrio sp. TaxID=2910990 RepID=UPI0031582598
MPDHAANGQPSRLTGFLQSLGGKGGVFAAGLGVTVLVAILCLARPGWLAYQDLKLYDELARNHRPGGHGDLPVIVDIDEASLAAYGQWPWPRYRIALLLSRLRQLGSRAVGLDMLLAEPDRTSPRVVVEQLRRDLKVEAAVTGLPEALRDYDQVLADVLRQGPFVLGYYFEFPPSAAPGAKPAAPCPLPPLRLAVQSGPGAAPLAESLVGAAWPVCPLPRLLAAAPGAGFFNIVPDADGILRRCPLLVALDGKAYPSLALATVLEAYGVREAVARTTAGGLASLTLRGQALGERVVPLDASGMLLIDYRGPGGSFPRVSAADVLADRVPAEGLAGKIVFVGTSAAGLGDLRASPLDQAMPGVEVHATIADMLVTGGFLYRPDWALGAELLALCLVGVLSAALLAVTGALALLAPFAALAAGVWYGAAALLRQGVFLSPLGPLLVLAANFTALTFLKFWREERQKRFLHGAFSRYVSPAVVSRIVSNRQALTLSGEEREITILFSDVRGFSTLSENLAPTQVADLLQGYFTPMTGIITAHMGTLDKLIGDAIMAFWNAPVDVPGHRALALRAALAMRDELDRLNPRFKATFGLAIKAGLALHCGVVRVGNFGTKDLFDYTVIGDAVNLCSRLEGLTKVYGTRLLVTDSLMADDDGEFVFEEIDVVRVKGKRRPVTIHTVRTAAEYLAGEAQFEAARQARALYAARRFAEAATAYQALWERHNRRRYALFAVRSRELALSPPPDDWDGVYEPRNR